MRASQRINGTTGEFMMLRQCSIVLIGTGALIAACPALVAAADVQSGPAAEVQAEPAAALEAVVVTGTRIRAPNLASESPVTAVSDEDIKDQGATNIETVLNELPQFHVGQSNTAVNHSTGVADLNLRGLGPTRTLVLIDGRRLGPGDPQDANGAAADVNFILAEVLSGVDVLMVGGS